MDQIKILRQEIKTIESQEGLDQKSIVDARARLNAAIDKLIDDDDKKESKTKIEDDKKIVSLLDAETKDIGNFTQKCVKLELKLDISKESGPGFLIKGPLNIFGICKMHTHPYTHVRFYMNEPAHYIKSSTIMHHIFTYFGINNVILYKQLLGEHVGRNLFDQRLITYFTWSYRQILKLCIDNNITDPVINNNCTFSISSQPTNKDIWDVVLKPDHEFVIELDSRYHTYLPIAPRNAFNEHLEKITQELIYDGKNLYSRAEFAALVAKYVQPKSQTLATTRFLTKVAAIDIHATHPDWRMFVRVRTQQMEEAHIKSLLN